MYNKIYEEIENIKIQGFNEKVYKNIKKLGIKSLHDLLYYFPRGYDNRTNMKKIGDIRGEEYLVVKGVILTVTSQSTKNKLKIVKARITDGTGIIDVIWFQMPYLKKSLKIGEEYIFIGNIKNGYVFQMINPEFKLVKNQQSYTGEILPIYSTNKDISQNTLRNILKIVLENYKDRIYENIPKDILDKYKILDRKIALQEIHFPSDEKILEDAKRRFAIEELLILEMGILQKRFLVDFQGRNKYQIEGKKEIVKKYVESLNFQLTKAQKKVITEIYKNLNEGRIINYLIQGDVGSGKTVVAILLLLYIIENGYQGVLMAPTEILATQHYLSTEEIFRKLGIEIQLLTGSIKGKKREKILENIKNGNIKLILGTHALIQEDVEFKNLGLIVIDEQHRFGVAQRKALRDKGILSNLIVMSATPIPRSLALSIYGDLDVGIIDELPPGRKPIKTKWINTEIDKEKMYSFIRKKLQEGRQAYFVAPLIDESEKLSAKSTLELKEEVETYLKEFKVGILHGRMSNIEKDVTMKEFKNKKLDILISTLVIEVGVNVPNASIIVISDSERFGLSTLHQLRGRVGRGEHQSYCFLISKTENATSEARLKILEETLDGFKIAEEDLKLRKAGEIFGTKQSGISDLKFIDIVHDVKTIKLVKDIVTEYLKENNGKIKNPILEKDIEEKFKDSLTS
ncbi:MAG: ATP-dependent DNA helicase RecG [Cetobacterium sp.]